MIVEKKEMSLLYKKELDYSLLTEGFTIPNDVLPLFIDVFGEVPPGNKRNIKINFNDDLYQAEFRHVNIKDNPRYQIRYSKNGDLSQHLKAEYSDAFKTLNSIRESGDEQKKIFAKLPDEKKEYILICYAISNGQLIFKQPKSMKDFKTVIKRFIDQANEANSLKVNDYPKEFDELRVVVSFGKGNFAQIPWISFLYEGQETNNGIYPVLLYYKDRKKVVLAYGISEENKSQFAWPVTNNMVTISEYFLSNGLGKPARYGSSYVYKVYDPEKIGESSVDKDLQQIILEYKEVIRNSNNDSNQKEIRSGKLFDIHAITEIEKTGLIFSNNSLYIDMPYHC
jgi:hypothetical protein